MCITSMAFMRASWSYERASSLVVGAARATGAAKANSKAAAARLLMLESFIRDMIVSSCEVGAQRSSRDRYAAGAVRSYRTVSSLPAYAGGLFSVALSRESPRLAVSQHPALWSPDFPPARFEGAGVRPGGSDRVEF